MSELEPIKIGFLGVGHSHAESYVKCISSVPQLTLVGVWDQEDARATDFAKRHETASLGMEQLLSRVDAVIVTSENASHHRLAKRSVLAGKDVLCEKPLAISVEDAKEIADLVEKSHTKFQMCHVMRYHPASRLVKTIIDKGDIGEVRAMIGTNRLNPRRTTRGWFLDPELSGGGAVMDHTVHLSDLMRWYTGSEIARLYCEIGKNLTEQHRVEEIFLTAVTFKNGAVGHLDGSWSFPGGYFTWGDVTMEIIGSGGVILLDAFRQNVVLVGAEPPTDKLTWQSFGPNADLEMIRAFCACVVNNREPIANVIDGLRGVELSLASYESSKRGEPVNL